MRHFFIRSLDLLIGLFVILLLISVIGASVLALTGTVPGPDGTTVSGVVPALLILLVGLLYVIFVGGFMYLGVGIYHNTKRTAEAVERMAGR